MNERSLPALIVLNVVLLIALALVGLSPAPAQAQLGATGGRYMMVSGDVRGRDQQAAVYLVDLSTSRMVSFFYNSLNDQLELIGATNINQDLARGTRNR